MPMAKTRGNHMRKWPWSRQGHRFRNFSARAPIIRSGGGPDRSGRYIPVPSRHPPVRHRHPLPPFRHPVRSIAIRRIMAGFRKPSTVRFPVHGDGRNPARPFPTPADRSSESAPPLTDTAFRHDRARFPAFSGLSGWSLASSCGIPRSPGREDRSTTPFCRLPPPVHGAVGHLPAGRRIGMNGT